MSEILFTPGGYLLVCTQVEVARVAKFFIQHSNYHPSQRYDCRDYGNNSRDYLALICANT